MRNERATALVRTQLTMFTKMLSLHTRVSNPRHASTSRTSNIHIYFWKGMTDDYFIALTGTEAEKLTIINSFRTADPNRPVTIERSDSSVNYLDVTVYKGNRLRTTGGVDTKLFTKPTSTELHPPYRSFHPLSTFDSILYGQHQRSLIASSGIEQHSATMLQNTLATCAEDTQQRN